VTSTRVLCYAPYNRWALHGQWEMTILHALRLRGAEVHYVLCDGLYTDCDQFWGAVAPRPAHACASCQADVTRLVSQMGMDFRWLGRYLTVEEQREALAWAASLADQDLLSAHFGEWPISEWMRLSLQSHLRCSEPDLQDPAAARAARSYAYSGLIACRALDRLLRESEPDVLLLFNGRQSSTRVALELARRRGVRTIVHERGSRNETLLLVENETAISLEPVRRYWREWGEVPLSAQELADITRLMHDREHGRNTGWDAFTTAPQPDGRLFDELDLDPARPVWALFTSSDDEVAGSADRASSFASQLDWIEATVDYAAAHPSVQLVVRVHPNTGSRRSTGANRAQLQQMEALASRLPANVRLVSPDTELSSYALMDACSVGLIWVSTVGLELACKGKTVVSAAGNYLTGTAIGHDVTDRAQYGDLLDGLRQIAPGAVDERVRRLALRLAYGFFFRSRIDFPLVEMPNPHEGRLRYRSLAELAPGADLGLDRCVRIILDGEPVCPPPGPAELARTSADEAATGPAEPIVTVVVTCFNYGRWLAEAVHSVLAQTFVGFELLIVDDGSTDDSLAVARELAALDSRIRVIAQENSGQPAVPRNRAIEQARGRYVLCLDADDRLSPDVLARTVAVLDADPRAGVACYAHQAFGISDERHDPGPWSVDALIRRNLHHCAALYRRDAWQAAGGYSLNVRGYEDWDLWLGIAEAGFITRVVHGPLMHYRTHAGGVYNQTAGTDQPLKAQMVLNRSSLFEAGTRLWAERVLAGDPAALAIGGERGVIPRVTLSPSPPAVAAPVTPDPDPEPAPAPEPVARATVVLAFAEELVADPVLLEAYGSLVGGDDDVTLVIVLPDEGDPAPLIAAVAAAGLDGEEAAELIAVPTEPPVAHAVLSRRAYRDLERIDETRLDALARLIGVRAPA